MQWSYSLIAHVSILFFVAGVAEIGGGWLVWQAVREQKPWWWAVAGGAVLMLYGFVPTLQPLNDFGRLYAVYGGVFIGLSFVWGYLFDGIVPDTGDWVGSIVALGLPHLARGRRAHSRRQRPGAERAHRQLLWRGCFRSTILEIYTPRP